LHVKDEVWKVIFKAVGVKVGKKQLEDDSAEVKDEF
jgi:hypothetical protein